MSLALPLQWSRPQQRTETGSAVCDRCSASNRFNGAVLSRGRRPADSTAVPFRGCSSFNGAVLSRGRRLGRFEFGVLGEMASMEPSSAEDGDPTSGKRKTATTPASFNGAVLSRGRRPATQRHQQFRLDGFNGAVLSRGRRPYRRRYCYAACSRFNGAVLSRGRRQTLRGQKEREKAALQWSRPQQRTETAAEFGDCAVVGSASMEPSSAEDGDTIFYPQCWCFLKRFNGAVLSRGRRPVDGISIGIGKASFNGAVLSRGRRPSSILETNFQPSGFNGAVLSRGRRHRDQSAEAV